MDNGSSVETLTASNMYSLLT